MNERKKTTLILMTAFLVISTIAGAELAVENARRLSSAEAVALAAKKNPALNAVLLTHRRAEIAVDAELGNYPFVLRLEGAHNHNASPTITADNDVRTRTSDVTSLGAEISKSFPVGTTASFRLGGDRQTIASPTYTADGFETTDAAYGLSAVLALNQPLLRGAGKRVGEAGLRQARIQQEIAKRKTEQTASELTRDVLLAYWSLWYANSALEIERAARDLARDQLDEIEARVAAGQAAPVDSLAFETRLASLEEAVVNAESERLRLGIELKRLVGEVDDRPLLPRDEETPPLPDAPLNVDMAVGDALQKSPEVLSLASEVTLADDQIRLAGESMRPSLNLTGQLQARIVGNRNTDPMYEQLAENVYSAQVGVVYELPLDDTRRRSERAVAELQAKIARRNLASASDRINAQVRAAALKLASSRQKMTLAQKTATVAENQARAAREKFELGSAVYLEVKEAEETARQAKLRFTQSQIDTAKAGIELSHLTGELIRLGEEQGDFAGS